MIHAIIKIYARLRPISLLFAPSWVLLWSNQA
uniref:Uncharacterized protein n=1 Tax=Rhizophora mucronata TaxID=61149 RepID=A0A2P2J2F0_RHIMU